MQTLWGGWGPALGVLTTPPGDADELLTSVSALLQRRTFTPRRSDPLRIHLPLSLSEPTLVHRGCPRLQLH